MRLSLLEESHLKGVKEGEILKARYAVLTILKTRFQTVPSTVKNRIGAIADEIVLNSLLVEATMCQSMDEFEQSL